MVFKKRSVSLYGHQTSLALEPEFWDIIDAYVESSGESFAKFIRDQDDIRLAKNTDQNLASYLRVWVLKHIIETR